MKNIYPDMKRLFEETGNRGRKLSYTPRQIIEEFGEYVKSLAESPIELVTIFFDYASCEITPIEDAKVERIADYILTHGGEYRIEGYSSPDGNSYNNQKLSGERAFVVYQALMGYGVPQDRLIPMANGVTSQFGDDSTLNRMVIVRKSEYGN